MEQRIVTIREEEYLQLVEGSIFNPNTGELNMRGLSWRWGLYQKELKAELFGVGKSLSDDKVAVFFGDVVGLKEINDKYSFEEGTQALKTVARVIGNTLDAHDIFAMPGGDELAIIARCTTNQAEEIRGRLLQSINETDFSLRGRKIPLEIYLEFVMVNCDANVPALLLEVGKEFEKKKRGERITKEEVEKLI